MSQRVPVVVLHWNNPEGALRTARVIRAHAPVCDVTIVENGSSPEARTELERRAAVEGLRVLHSARNLGFAGGMNFGVLHSGLCESAEFVLCCCHGVELTPGSVERLVAALERDPSIGLMAPRPSHDTPASFDAPPGWESVSGDDFVEIVRAAGGALMFRVAAFRDVGGFDERMFAYYEDIDIAKRLRKSGWKTAMVPDAVMVEDGSTLARFGRVYLIARNQIISSEQDGRVAVLRQAFRTALNSGRSLLASLAPWRSAERRAASRVFARGNFYGVADALFGVTGPGRAATVMPQEPG